MANKNDETISKLRDHHVIYCTTGVHAVKGTEAEQKTVEYLLKNLDETIVGDYRLLVNYNIMEQDQTGKRGNSLEVDVVVINRLGIFLLEVKDWRGTIEGYDDVWVFKGRVERPNAWKSVDLKSRVLYNQLFGKSGKFRNLDQVSVIGLVVLTQGVRLYERLGSDNIERIVDLNNALIEGLSSHRLLHRRYGSAPLSDQQIKKEISPFLHHAHVPPENVVRDYRLERILSEGDLYSIAFEAQHMTIPNLRVRLKRYQLPSLLQSRMDEDLHHFQRSVQALSALEDEYSHPNILRTRDFLDDNLHRPDVFYEVTELPTGPSLAEVMEMNVQQGRKMSLIKQLVFLESVGKALRHAHNHKNPNGRGAPIYHRNICPETIFQMRNDTIKLGDFDFAKMVGERSVTKPGTVLIEKDYTAPEILKFPSLANATSDIYALGVLWYFMACLPQEPKKFDPALIDDLALPQEARTLLKRMTAEKPYDRPQKIEEVLEELGHIKEKEQARIEEEKQARAREKEK